ncbi:MAG: hypothetical protein JZU52_00095 [Lamprocystis purpurea]|jgi:hypothetical protein|uniref:hypothetical protein n=1 Tax=Lamprocystis purpurea TaxID=61598 RepID=UPI0003A5B4C8|nr:hypothetical protein [Lamprocystis purpurea]MBV5272089.1 hypothetical protein [Lamprocystis purpurea]
MTDFSTKVWAEERQIVVNAMHFTLVIALDDRNDPPWEQADGHGPVSDWTRREKRPGERVLHRDRTLRRYYDVATAQRIALRERWGAHRPPVGRPRVATRLHGATWCDRATVARLQQWLTARFGTKPPSVRMVAAQAVEEDFQYLRAWCNNAWGYLGYTVTLLDEEGRPTVENDACWGFESCDDYILSAAKDAAAVIAERVRTSQHEAVRAEQRAMFDAWEMACT